MTLTVRKDASANQHAYATLVLTNHGQSVCSLSGFPGVSLLANGDQVGPDATRANVSYSPVELEQGQAAHAQLAVLTSCNAPKSDTVRVFPPNQNAALSGPLSVYACSSEISPMQPGAS